MMLLFFYSEESVRLVAAVYNHEPYKTLVRVCFILNEIETRVRSAL